MQIERSLARELLIKHELTRMLRIKVEFVNENSGFFAAGSNERMQCASQLLFVPWGCLDVSVDDDRCFGHESRNELKKEASVRAVSSYLCVYGGVKRFFPATVP